MKIAHFLGSMMAIGLLAACTSGCFATRMVRTDTITSYDVVPMASQASAEPIPAPVMAAAPQGTLVVEALVVPPPPASAARPVRLPDAVAASLESPRHETQPAPAPAWDPLPSYVAQFTGPGWHRRPIFGSYAQSSSSFQRWAPFPGHTAATIPYGYTTPGAYGSASPHFSSAPSFSGSVSSHFAGGYPSSGF